FLSPPHARRPATMHMLTTPTHRRCMRGLYHSRGHSPKSAQVECLPGAHCSTANPLFLVVHEGKKECSSQLQIGFVAGKRELDELRISFGTRGGHETKPCHFAATRLLR